MLLRVWTVPGEVFEWEVVHEMACGTRFVDALAAWAAGNEANLPQPDLDAGIVVAVEVAQNGRIAVVDMEAHNKIGNCKGYGQAEAGGGGSPGMVSCMAPDAAAAAETVALGSSFRLAAEDNHSALGQHCRSSLESSRFVDIFSS